MNESDFMRIKCEDFVDCCVGRILCLDVGDKTVGVGVSDERQVIASSVSVIRRKSMAYDMSELEKIIKQLKPIAIVYGWPLQTDGSEGGQCEKVEEFIQYVEKQFDIPLMRWDERFSTKVTTSVLISADMSRKKRKDVIDKIAASYILQGVLDFLSNLRRMKNA